jgi:BlaI family penicillinase repressor
MEKSSEWELLAVELDTFADERGSYRKRAAPRTRCAIEELIRSAEGAISRRDVAGLRSATEKLKRCLLGDQLSHEMSFWKEQLAWLRKQTAFVDSLQAERLKEEGARALKRSDIGSLRTIVWNLYALLADMATGQTGQAVRRRRPRKYTLMRRMKTDRLRSGLGDSILEPTPPAAPETMTVSPACRATLRTAAYAVVPATKRAPACSHGTFAGRGTRLPDSTSTSSAWLDRSLVNPMTSSPTPTVTTSGPTSSATPARSLPWPEGNVEGQRSANTPCRIAASPGLMPAALTRTRTFPGPGIGRSTFTTCRTSIPPYFSNLTARGIELSPFGRLRLRSSSLTTTKHFVYGSSMKIRQSNLPKPTEGELELLRVLWVKGSATVRELHDSVSQERALGYTTVLKLLQIMTEKGLVQRTEVGRAHVYRTTASQEETQSQLLRDLSERLFSGSATQLAMHALTMEPATSDELKEIRKLIDRKQEKR